MSITFDPIPSRITPRRSDDMDHDINHGKDDKLNDTTSIIFPIKRKRLGPSPQPAQPPPLNLPSSFLSIDLQPLEPLPLPLDLQPLDPLPLPLDPLLAPLPDTTILQSMWTDGNHWGLFHEYGGVKAYLKMQRDKAEARKSLTYSDTDQYSSNNSNNANNDGAF